MGKKNLLAETGAGQHGVATAAAAAKLEMGCAIFMGALDIERQASNVARMKLLGAEVHPVRSGTRTLKDAINEALRAWIAHQADALLLRHRCRAASLPTLVRELQKIIGEEIKEQLRRKTGRLPDAVVACVGGGSSAIGAFYPFASDSALDALRLIGVEAGGTNRPGCYNSAPAEPGRAGRAARAIQHVAAGCGRPDPALAFGFRRAGLSGSRAGACRAVRVRPGRIPHN